MKKILLSLLMLLSFTVNPVSAKDNFNENDWILVNENYNYILNKVTGEKIYKAYEYNKNNELVEISLNEYVNKKNNENKEYSNYNKIYNAKNNEKTPTYQYKSTFKQIGKAEKDVTLKGYKVSADVYGGSGGATVSTSQSITITEGFSINGSLNFSEVSNKIRASLGFSWNKQASTQATSGASYKVPPYKKAYIQFTPYYTKVEGHSYLEKYSVMGHFVSKEYKGVSCGYSPQKLVNGIADGVYELRIK